MLALNKASEAIEGTTDDASVQALTNPDYRHEEPVIILRGLAAKSTVGKLPWSGLRCLDRAAPGPGLTEPTGSE